VESVHDAVTHMKSPFAGRYTIERELGRGGMATVYRARDIRHDRAVALKVLHRELAASMGAERFAREIRLLAGLHHPHILPLFDSGEYEGAVFYVVPCVEGESLRRRLEREKQLQLDEAIRITREVADALDHAHRNGVIHRDIKPENILLEEGHAIVADFGVARAVTRSVGESQTTAGMAVGTPAYMSPEQASGERELDGRSDQYSLACVLYEMLAGTPPFSGTTPRATIARRFTEAPPSIRSERNVPESLDRAIQRALSPVPADRFPDVHTFAKALEGEAAPRPSARRVAALGIPAVAAVALVLVLSRPGPGGANTLDPGLHAVIPFAVDDESALGNLDGAAAARYLSRALGRWEDVRLVDPVRVVDAVARRGQPQNLGDAIAVARDLGAGRLVWGDLWTRGDSAEVRAGVYDVTRGREVRSARMIMGLGVVNAAAAFDTLGENLTLGNHRGAAAGSGALATRVSEALRRYEAGHQALSEWELQAADGHFRAALELDPEFAQAALWSAQAQAWRGAEPRDWLPHGRRAVRFIARLDSTERLRARGLLALAEGRYPDACEQYRTLLARDTLDFGGWFGLGDCQALDPVVEPDQRSASGWRFRGSLHSGLQAYARALRLLPSFHQVRATTDAPLPLERFPIEPEMLRRGYALTPDTMWMAAVPAVRAETLSVVPYPIADVLNGSAGWPDPSEAAWPWAREQLRQIAEPWVRAFPSSALAREAFAAALESVGELRPALEETERARGLTTDSSRWWRLTKDVVRLKVKLGDFAGAHAVADSALRRRPTPTSSSVANALSGVAALIGHAELTRELLELQANDSTSALVLDGEIVAAPTSVHRAALALLAYASFPEPRDSVIAYTRVLNRAIDLWVPPARRNRVRAAAMSLPVTFGFWQMGPRSVLNVRMPTVLNRMQRAFARGERTAVVAIWDSAAGQRAEHFASDARNPEFTYQEALLLLAVGDTTRAIAHLDAALTNLSLAPRWFLSDVHRPAALAPMMRLRALLAESRGDLPGAARWARAAMSLWRGADPPLRKMIEPLSALADTTPR
jgi:tRNA A-37 threonylcarbamoyl transferase component Bud32/tetratricopeptide (TPR) repeat protein